MKTLCELKRCKETVTRGRFAGNETEFSLCVGGDNYSWNINRKNLNAETPPIGQKYFKGFCHLLGYLPEFDIDIKDATGKIISALEKNTGISFEEAYPEFDRLTTPKEIGEFIDKHFRCNYNKTEHDSGKQTDQDRIYIRVLKAKVGEKD